MNFSNTITEVNEFILSPLREIRTMLVLTRGVQGDLYVYSLVKHVAQQHQCTQIEAEKTIDMFTSSVIDAMGKGNEISLIGFGNFSVSKVAARSGRNPRTGEALEIAAYNQLKLKVGQKLKSAVNSK